MIIPIDEFFKKMRLSDEEIKRREDLAEELFFLFQYFFWEITADYIVNDTVDTEYYKEMLYTRYKEDIETYVVLVAALLEEEEILAELDEDIRKRVSDIVDTTVKNIETEFFTSNDRATELGENETNFVGNTTDYKQSVAGGYTKKVWLTMADDKVRDTHAMVDGETIGIDEYFNVGGAEMLYPMDMSRNAYDYPQETVNCRCTIAYLR